MPYRKFTTIHQEFRKQLAGLPFILLFLMAAGMFGETELTAAPAIAGIEPQFGPPGTQVLITGAGFGNATSVEIGDQVPADFEILSSSSLVAIVPPNGLTAPIKVNTLAGSASSTLNFFVSPRLTSFFPRQGSANTTVTINGANFLQGGTWVVFGSVTSQVVQVTAPTQLQTQVPEGATNSIIHVYTGAGGATSVVEFISSDAPLIEDFTPKNGLPGSMINMTINGANFLGTTNVSFNGTNAAFVVTAETQISVPTIPADATSGKIRVGTANGEAFSDIDFIVGPTIDYFDPVAGDVGDFINIFGNDFSGLTNVSFNGITAVEGTVIGPTLLNVRVPEGASTGKIRVGASTGEGFSELDFTVGPFVSSLEPAYGPIGSQITIRGAGFDQNTEVYFGGVQSDNVSSSAPNLIFALVPIGATNAPISVVTADATNTTSQTFFVTTGIPFIERFLPASGPTGTEITLHGADFVGVTGVMFGGVPAGFSPPAAPTQMKVYVPPGALTGKIEVSNANGTGTSFEDFHATPRIVSFSPQSGMVDSVVGLTGTNFLGITDLYIGGEPAEVFSIDNDAIFAILTTNVRSGPIQIETPGGSFITTSNFTVLPQIVDVNPKIGPVDTPVTIVGNSFFGVTNVAFNGTDAEFMVISPQEISTAVPFGATSGLIRVGTVEGESFSPTPFVVTIPTDLAVSENTSTNIVLPGTTVSYVSTIDNLGLSAATGVALTNTFPETVEIQTAIASQGGCSIEGRVVICSLGVLPIDLTVSVTIEAVLPLSRAYTNIVEISSVEGDTNVGNDTTRSKVVAVTDDERTLDVQLLSATDQVVISWKISPVPFQLQYLPELTGSNTNWSNILTAPFQINGTNRFTNGSSFSDEYYRLSY